jgi:large subunit ribosomal protein L29
MKIEELRNLSNEELTVKRMSLKEDLFKLNQQRYSGRVEKSHQFGVIKRNIARIQTILKERQTNKNGKV